MNPTIKYLFGDEVVESCRSCDSIAHIINDTAHWSHLRTTRINVYGFCPMCARERCLGFQQRVRGYYKR